MAHSEYVKNIQNIKTVQNVSHAVAYVNAGGSLTDCYPTLLNLFEVTCFADGPDILGQDEADCLLLAVLSSKESRKMEAVECFEKETIKSILKAFQRRCCCASRSKLILEKKNQWKSILRETYANFFDHRETIYQSIIDFFMHISKVCQPNSAFSPVATMADPDEKVIDGFYGVASLLEVVGAIIQGFDEPLKRSHIKRLLQSALLPLHNNTLPKTELECALSIYHRQLSFCVEAFIQKDAELVSFVATKLCYMLPKLIKGGFSKPSIFLINECEMLFEQLPLEEFGRAKTSFFAMVQTSIESFNFMVAQRALLLLQQPAISVLCDSVSQYYDSTIIPMLLRICKTHWNDTTKQMAYQVLVHQSQKPNNRISNNATFKQIQDSYNERWQSDKDSETKKQKRMLVRKPDLSFTKIVFVTKLGEGSYSQVHHIRRIDHSVSQLFWEDYAMKTMETQQLMEQNYLENAKFEIHLLKNIFKNHPNIIKYIGEFTENDKIFLVLEFASRGDLFGVINRLGSVDESYTRFAMSQLCNALRAVHSKGILHLDLKPENVLISHTGTMKLTDFGSALNVSEISSAYQLQGTAEYLSPSLVDGNRPEFADDVWALGCVLYQLLAGTTPFNDGNREGLFTKIRERKLIFPSTFPPVAKDLVSQIFSVGTDKYTPMTLMRVMKHEFFVGLDWKNVNAGEPPLPLEGTIKVDEIDSSLRQRKFSMMLTQNLPGKYQFSSFALEPVPESTNYMECDE